MQSANDSWPIGHKGPMLGLKILGWILVGSMTLSVPALAQQKTGPGITGDDSLTWHGITLYGVIDIGVQYDTHSAPFTPYRPAASGNIVRQNSQRLGDRSHAQQHGPVESRPAGHRGPERRLVGRIPGGDFLQSPVRRNRRFSEVVGREQRSSLASQSVGVDGSSAGQAFQTACVGLKSARFGTLTFGRQVTLLLGRHHQVRPQLQRHGVRPAGRIEHLFRRRRAAKTTGSIRR